MKSNKHIVELKAEYQANNALIAIKSDAIRKLNEELSLLKEETSNLHTKNHQILNQLGDNNAS